MRKSPTSAVCPGMAIKAGYKAVQGVKPGFVRTVMNDLLPEFAASLDPLYQEAVQAGETPSSHILKNKDRAADALLAITDGKADRSTNTLVKKTYGKLRPTAKAHVEAAIPRLSKLIDSYSA